MSNTYRKQQTRKSFDKLAASSSDLMDYRARLCYVSIAHKHPSWDSSVIKALAEAKAMWITLFQAPLEWLSRKRLKRTMKKANKRASAANERV